MVVHEVFLGGWDPLLKKVVGNAHLNIDPFWGLEGAYFGQRVYQPSEKITNKHHVPTEKPM